ncbi:hypothetical protein Purlil1_2979 [Purpureocillium lilacinum]|uniref:Kelch repeat protein n=1 Tax=Purpureocillium lilacinum TaxID=33203 RepID=A0ABR0C9C9_PURLI|nr:hypothetical protein Purlil1_2979 [Purpureocillium lilacinum]
MGVWLRLALTWGVVSGVSISTMATPDTLQRRNDNTNPFRRRALHKIAVLGDYLYMEGGETSTYVDGQMQHDAPSVPSENTISIPLDTSWSLSSTTNLTIPGHDPPPRNMFGLWADAKAGVLYRYGGEKSYNANVSLENQALWKFAPNNGGGGLWSVERPQNPEVFDGRPLGTRGRLRSATADSACILPVPGMMTYNATTKVWSKEEVVDPSSKEADSKGRFTTGEAQCVTGFGPNPIVVALGGWYADFQTVSMYDTVKEKWFWQRAGGSVPRVRENYCAVGVRGPQGTFEIFIHGGTNSADGTLSDTFVLSLPAFTWFKVDVNAPARMGHACAVVGKRQMLISGGLAVQWDWKTNDEWVGARKVLDMTALEFRDGGYDAGAGAYEPAQVIKDWYYKGGMANVEWASDDVKALFNVNVDMNRTSVSPTLTPTPTPLFTPSTSKSPSAGAIAGSVIGGVAFVLLVSAAAFLFLRRRLRQQQLRRQYRTTAELTDKASPRSELETKERPRELVAPAQVSGGMYEMPG